MFRWWWYFCAPPNAASRERFTKLGTIFQAAWASRVDTSIAFCQLCTSLKLRRCLTILTVCGDSGFPRAVSSTTYISRTSSSVPAELPSFNFQEHSCTQPVLQSMCPTTRRTFLVGKGLRAEDFNMCVESAGSLDSVVDDRMEEVLARLQQPERANAALQTELRGALA